MAGRSVSSPSRFFVPATDQTGPSAASQTLLPNLFDESVDTFFTPVVKGKNTLTPSLYTDADTFFTPVVTSRLTLLPALYTDPDTFFNPVVKGLNRVTPSLYVDADTFFTPVVKGRNTLSPGLYSDADTFFSPIARGLNTLTPGLFVDSDAFFTPTVSISGGSSNLFPDIFTNQVNFFTPSISGGTFDLSFTQGGGKQRKFRKVESSNVESVLHEGDTLTIRYRDGSVYNYADVPEKKFNRLVNSRSPGSFVHTKIKDRHDYRRFY